MIDMFLEINCEFSMRYFDNIFDGDYYMFVFKGS